MPASVPIWEWLPANATARKNALRFNAANELHAPQRSQMIEHLIADSSPCGGLNSARRDAEARRNECSERVLMG
jgi:hypothetical protein